jgi:error-prone DNA polymerase
MSGAEIRSILEARAERPFRSVGDFLRRTCVSRPVAEAIAHAGGFDALETGSRRDRLFVAMTAKPDRVGDQLELNLETTPVVTGNPAVGAGGFGERGLGGDWPAERRPPAPVFSLPEYTDAEKVRAELEVLGLDAYRHIMSFYGPLLDELGVVRAEDLWRHRGEEWVMVAGVKVASQTPAVRSGQRIIFLSLDDGTGVTEVTVFERVQPKVARTVFHSYALAVWGRLRRTGVRGVSIIAEDVWDLVALHRARRDGELGRALAGRGTGSLPPRKLWHASGGSVGW